MTSFFGWSRDNIKYLIKFLTTHNILDIVFRKRNLLSRIRCDFPVPKIDWIRVMSIFQLSDFTKKTTSKCSVDVEQGDGTKTRPSDTGSKGPCRCVWAGLPIPIYLCRFEVDERRYVFWLSQISTRSLSAVVWPD